MLADSENLWPPMGRRIVGKTAMEDVLSKAFAYYRAHQAELVEKFNGKVIVIHNDEVFGAFDDEAEAVRTARRKELPPGSFLVQRVLPGTAGYTQTFHSRVSFV